MYPLHYEKKMIPCPFADYKHTCHIVSGRMCVFTVSRWMRSCFMVKEYRIYRRICMVRGYIILYLS